MDRFYVIGPGYTDEPTFFKLLAKYFPDATTFYAEGLSISKDIAACYSKHMEKGERLPHKVEPQIYSLSFSQELMEELAILSENHDSTEYLFQIDLYKESESLLRWHDAFLNGSPIEISGLVPEEVVSKFASELGWKYRVSLEDVTENMGGDPFTKVTFRPLPALWNKEKHSCTPYQGGEYDKEKYDLVEGMWDHGHCDTCTRSINDGDTYWTSKSDYQMLCEECHDEYLRHNPDLPADEDPLWVVLKKTFAVIALAILVLVLVLLGLIFLRTI